MNIFWGLTMMIAGFYIVAKSEWLLNNFGRIGFFDKFLGTAGGSRLGYKMMGIIAIFFGILVLTNLIDRFMLWVLSPIINAGAF